MFPLAEKNFISHALEATETFEEVVDLLMYKNIYFYCIKIKWKLVENYDYS